MKEETDYNAPAICGCGSGYVLAIDATVYVDLMQNRLDFLNDELKDVPKFRVTLEDDTALLSGDSPVRMFCPDCGNYASFEQMEAAFPGEAATEFVKSVGSVEIPQVDYTVTLQYPDCGEFYSTSVKANSPLRAVALAQKECAEQNGHIYEPEEYEFVTAYLGGPELEIDDTAIMTARALMASRT